MPTTDFMRLLPKEDVCGLLDRDVRLVDRDRGGDLGGVLAEELECVDNERLRGDPTGEKFKSSRLATSSPEAEELSRSRKSQMLAALKSSLSCQHCLAMSSSSSVSSSSRTATCRARSSTTDSNSNSLLLTLSVPS